MKLYQMRRKLQDGDVLDAGDVGETDKIAMLSKELTARGQVERYINAWGRVATVVRPLEAVIVKGPESDGDSFAELLSRLSRGGKLW